jgi:hypothetical protein
MPGQAPMPKMVQAMSFLVEFCWPKSLQVQRVLLVQTGV